jgi:hypothetical protein
VKRVLIILVLVISAFSMFFFGNRKDNVNHDQIIFTQIPVQAFKAGSIFPERARIVSINSSNPESSFEILSKEFYSARSPHTSFDGTRVLFSGKLNSESIWQIFEIDLNSHKFIQLTDQPANCTDPAYLPDGNVLFSQEIEDDVTGKSFALFKTNKENSKEQITFHPHKDLLSTVSLDGRVITNSIQIFPMPGKAKLLAMRPDGTKATLYYQSPEGYTPVSRGYEIPNDQFVFIEESDDLVIRELVSISINRPLNSRASLAKGGFYDVYPTNDNNLIISYQENPEQPIGLFLFNPIHKKVGVKIYLDNDYHSLEVVESSKRIIPKKLPTRVDHLSETGKMICMSTHITDLDPENEYRTNSVLVMGMNNILGNVEVEKDGSFYIEIEADKPVRFQALDADGNEILEPSSWLWVRPNESQGCVGCHADRELAPNNQVPEAINKLPVSFFHKDSESE